MVIFDKRESLHQNDEFVNNVDVTVKVTMIISRVNTGQSLDVVV